MAIRTVSAFLFLAHIHTKYLTNFSGQLCSDFQLAVCLPCQGRWYHFKNTQAIYIGHITGFRKIFSKIDLLTLVVVSTELLDS